MRCIETKVHTVLERGNPRAHYVADVAKDNGRRIDSYEELVDVVAELAYHNWRYTLLYRGQHTDHPATRSSGEPSTIFPSIWRHHKGRRHKAFNDLQSKCHCLQKLASFERRDKRRLRMVPERPWAILQHYSDVANCDTPLLDVTESIRVAASFATQGHLGQNNNKRKTGVVLVLGFPAIQEGTTVSVDNGLIMLRLASVCPQAARRPHFQSGYAVGSFPTKDVGYKPPKDFAHRLIAKLRITTTPSFWDVDKPLAEHALFPDNDLLRDEIANAYGGHV